MEFRVTTRRGAFLDNHRLFVGLTIDPVAADSIHHSAVTAYEGQPVRVVEASQMHSTLMFFPSVSKEKMEWMADLVRQVEWQAIAAKTGTASIFGRGALALDLLLPEYIANTLDDRLIRACTYDDNHEYHQRLREEPLGQLSLEQGPAQWEPQIRRQRQRETLNLHVTFARFRKALEKQIVLHDLPSVDVSLAKVALFESHLGPGGSRYEIISESA